MSLRFLKKCSFNLCLRLLIDFANFRSVSNLFETVGVRYDNFFDPNTCFLKDCFSFKTEDLVFARYISYGVKYLFFLYRNLSLLLILFITFKAIASPDKLSSNSHLKYITFEYCLILTSPYCIPRVPIFLFRILV